MNQNEIWKDIPNYVGMYQVSNLGRVKSLARARMRGRSKGFTSERILKFHNNRGYHAVGLYVCGVRKILKVHQLVAMAFLNHTPCRYKRVVDHINGIIDDNRVENLQVVTQRENASKDRKGGASKYVGVDWHKQTNKWRARIRLNGKRAHLGEFTNELEASEAHQKALKEII